MSAMLNVGQRESRNPMSMKSTTPSADRMRSIRLPTRTAAHERERQRSNRVAGPRRRVQAAENHERDDRQHHEDPSRVLPDVQAERGARIVDEREPHPVAVDLVRHVLRDQPADGERLRAEIDRRRPTPARARRAPSYFFASSSRCLQSMQ